MCEPLTDASLRYLGGAVVLGSGSLTPNFTVVQFKQLTVALHNTLFKIFLVMASWAEKTKTVMH